MENANTKEYLEKYKLKIFQHLKALNGAPSVQMQEVPPDFIMRESEESHPDQRSDQDGTRQHDAEFFDNDQDQDTIIQD